MARKSMRDLSIDTCVFVHAHNHSAVEHAPSKLLCELLHANEVLLCVDDGFALDESNKSLIGREYIDNLRAGSVGYELVAALARNGRIEFIVSELSANERRWLRRLIPHNPGDRRFAEVASQSRDKVLVTHDDRDYPAAVRAKLRERWKLRLEDAAAMCDRLVPEPP